MRSCLLLTMFAALALLGACKAGGGPVCEAGTAGCACAAAEDCAAPLQCIAGVCEAPNCLEGLEGCPCGEGCGAGLACNAVNYCVREAGGFGEPCYSNRTCDAGYLCAAGDICQVCEPGSMGCDCFDNDTCVSGLTCMAGRCSGSGGEPTVPKTIQCFTPCRQSFVDASGKFRACPVDGLMPGCVDGATCQRGSCVKGESVPRTCSVDVDCPDFQACIYGECLANCDYDSDCAAHERCYRHACRVPCGSSDGAGACPDETHCELTDAAFGFCTPSPDPGEGLPAEVPEGSVTLSDASLSLSNVDSVRTVTITNHAPRSIDFTLTRAHQASGAAPMATDQPLPWVRLGATSAPNFDDEISFRVKAGGELEVTVEVDDATPSRWAGALKLRSELGEQTIDLAYVSTPDGRWVGKAYYFTQFSDVGVKEYVEASTETKANYANSVRNALVRRFHDFSTNNLDRDNWDALLTAVLEESWDWPSTRAACPDNVGACYLFAGSADGVETLVTDPGSAPIPRGVVELPVALHLRTVGEGLLSGHFVSEETLHYVGDPGVTIAQTSSTCDPSADCRTRVTGIESTIIVGGRYPLDDASAECEAGFDKVEIPWLVPAFENGTVVDQSSGQRYRYECRHESAPFGFSEGDKALNAYLAQANPIPDGRSRARSLELVDGVLVDQEVYFLLFRETFSDSFLGAIGAEPLSAYGLMVLRRGAAPLQDEDFVGEVHVGHPDPVAPTLAAACDGAFDAADAISTPPLPVGVDNVDRAVRLLLHGAADANPTTPINSTTVHYLCHETGLFDQGAFGDPEAGECPAGSDVTYFSCPAGSVCDTDAKIRALPCQQRGAAGTGACAGVLDAWKRGGAGTPTPIFDLIATCADEKVVFCDSGRFDLNPTEGPDAKVFHPPPSPETPSVNPQVFAPLRVAVADAFRYKTQFQSRTGGNLAFAPEPCVSGSNENPYCYDAVQIENIRDRMNCLTSIMTTTTLRDELKIKHDEVHQDLVEALRFHFGSETDNGVHIVVEDGFERLNAELLVMLGDDAYTAAFQSRFDLAGTTRTSFEGSLFEPGGIDLSGVAGYELFTLYRATQYYGQALDRFFSLAPHLQAAIDDLDALETFATSKVVTAYLDRVLRASTQRTRAWSEIASRYQQLREPDLAALVVERAYASGYLESVVIGRMIERIAATVTSSERPGLVQDLERSAIAYRMALLEMREVYTELGGDLNYFGFAPDYVPLPAPETGGQNAFELLLARAMQSTTAAIAREETAIASSRAYETDEVAFQGELVRIRNSYDSRLLDLCGAVRTSDGEVFPATPTYAYLDPVASRLGNPCGLLGTGEIAQALGQIATREIALREVRQSIQNTIDAIASENQRVEDLCGSQQTYAQYTYKLGETERSLQDDIYQAQNTIAGIDWGLQTASTFASLAKCSVGTSSDCPTAATATAVFGAAQMQLGTVRMGKESEIRALQQQIGELGADEPIRAATLQCEQWDINSAVEIARLRNELAILALRGMSAGKETELAVARVQSLHDSAIRLLAEQQETEQLAINLEAAKNDPNVRIYRNDAILNAEWSFDAALADAYRATKAFEYFTSQSYAGMGALRLVRLAGRGDYNLQNYLAELEDAYDSFTEVYGRADYRVDIISLRDDVLAVPFEDAEGAASVTERVDQFRVALADGKYRDGKGRIVIPFATSDERLSPLTRNHKIDFIEIELIGSDVGDSVGRVYVRQTGTGMIARLGVDDGTSHYRFPDRTAVVNTFFNGMRVFGPEVYRSERLRDRPYINSGWELVFDQRGEWVNRDITLSSITDVRIYVHYTDFTTL